MRTGEVIALSPFFPELPIAIVTAVSEEYLTYFVVTLASIIKHSTAETFYDVVVLGSHISHQSEERVKALVAKHQNFHVRFLEVSDILKQYSFPVEEVYKPIIYARLLVPELLRNYNRAIYIDSDMIFMEDISTLYQEPFDDKLLLAVRDTGMLAWYYAPNSKEKEYIDKKLRLKCPDLYINSGLIVFNILEFCKKYSAAFLLRYAASQRWRWRDQDVLMTLCDTRIGLLSQEWNVLLPYFRDDLQLLRQAGQFDLAQEYQTAVKYPKVLHFIGTGFLSLETPPVHAERFWEIARKTEGYEIILYRALAFTTRKSPEFIREFSKINFNIYRNCLEVILSMFENGEFGFRVILKFIKKWILFKYRKLKIFL
ncbi:MAG: hypothetical protein HFE97_12355 [Oscillospiraceae bacterium]|nr:hypothetical protein [Oscillospiraceae bacterium]